MHDFVGVSSHLSSLQPQSEGRNGDHDKDDGNPHFTISCIEVDTITH